MRAMLPGSIADAAVLVVSAAIGIAIWIPTQASHPRYSYGQNQDMGSPSFIWLTVLAAVLLAAVFARRWQLVVPGLVASRSYSRHSPRHGATTMVCGCSSSRSSWRSALACTS
jgi:hypothetical protein